MPLPRGAAGATAAQRGDRSGLLVGEQMREGGGGYSPSPCGPPPRSQSLCGEGSSLKGCTSSTIKSPEYAVATRARYAWCHTAPLSECLKECGRGRGRGAHGGLAVVELRRPQLAHAPAAVGFLFQPVLLALSVVEPRAHAARHPVVHGLVDVRHDVSIVVERPAKLLHAPERGAGGRCGGALHQQLRRLADGRFPALASLRDGPAYEVRVTNTGERDADDAVLGFIVPPNAGEDGTPLQSLFGFERVHVPAGETVSVFLYPGLGEFAETRRDGSRAARAGEYTVRFGVAAAAEHGQGFVETKLAAF